MEGRLERKADNVLGAGNASGRVPGSISWKISRGVGKSLSPWWPRLIDVVGTDGRPHRSAEDDLTAVGCSADPRGEVDVLAPVVVTAKLRLTVVKPHPDPHLLVGGPGSPRDLLLDLARGRDRFDGVGEGRAEPVALVGELVPVVALEGVAHDPVVLVEHVGVVIAQPVQERGRALDVGEQQRDPSGREHRGGQRPCRGY